MAGVAVRCATHSDADLDAGGGEDPVGVVRGTSSVPVDGAELACGGEHHRGPGRTQHVRDEMCLSSPEDDHSDRVRMQLLKLLFRTEHSGNGVGLVASNDQSGEPDTQHGIPKPGHLSRNALRHSRGLGVLPDGDYETRATFRKLPALTCLLALRIADESVGVQHGPMGVERRTPTKELGGAHGMSNDGGDAAGPCRIGVFVHLRSSQANPVTRPDGKGLLQRGRDEAVLS
mmetsp:Transcript_14930/g.35080  ORF Transcript_14930/g.35080 Transcript_14930/m.35080 type:complete len:231 (+) Transcript_14930:312-1004(+)